ncbi:MAG: EH signature domain-containing protein [Rickettsiales bacterium]
MAGKLKEKLILFHSLPFKPPVLPQEPRLALKAAEVAIRFSGVPRPPETFELEPIYRRFMEALSTGKWDDISLRDWRYAPYVFWHGGGSLIKEASFRARYRAWLERQTGSAWKRLIGAYLREFLRHKDFPHIYRELSGWIRQGLQRPDMAKRLEIWRQRDADIDMFSDGFETEKAVAAFIKTCGSDMARFAEYTGMRGMLAQNGYTQAVAETMLDRLLRWTAELPKLPDTLLPFFDDGSTWRFPVLRASLLEALLLPWKVNVPSLEYQNRLQNLLLQRSGDPRLRNVRQDKWRGVSEDALAVLLRWLVGETIKQFFAVIDQVAEPQWQYRRAFWLAYYHKGYIDDAWVVFGKQARLHAVQSFGRSIGAGSISGGQHFPNHSILILKIGDYIFADWSHKGKCRAWSLNDRNCPKLHRLDYHADDFRKPSMQIVATHQEDGISHQGSENYRWQIRLAEFIRHNTGITMSQHDYRI